MARTSLSLFEEKRLPIDLQQEAFTFGEVVYLTVGGLGTADMVCLHLSPGQLADLQAAIAAFREAGRRP